LKTRRNRRECSKTGTQIAGKWVSETASKGTGNGSMRIIEILSQEKKKKKGVRRKGTNESHY